MKLPLARLQNGQVVRTTPRRSMGFAGRAEMLRLWDLMDADQQDQVLLAAAAIVERSDEVRVLAAKPTAAQTTSDVVYELERAIAQEMAAVLPLIRTGKR